MSYFELLMVFHCDLDHTGIFPHLVKDPQGSRNEGRGVVKITQMG